MENDALSAADAMAALAGMPDDAPDAEIEIREDDAPDDDADYGDDEIDAEDDVQADADDEGDDPDVDPDADEDEDDDEPDEPAIEAPQFLDEKMRADWEKLPREAKEMVLSHDRALVADYTRKTQALAEDRKAVQAQRQQLEQVVSQYDEVLPEVMQKAKEWQEVDWVRLKANTTADDFLAYQAQAQQDILAARQLQEKKQKAEVESLTLHVQTEKATLQEIAAARNAADLIDPAKSPKVTKELFDYVQSQGYAPDEIKWIGARDMVIALKAMKYDAMIARRKDGKPALTPKPDAKSKGKPVRGGARASSSKRSNPDVEKAFRKTGDTRLAMQLLKDFD